MRDSTSSNPLDAYIRDQFRLICTRYIWAPVSEEAEDEIVEYVKEAYTMSDFDASEESELFYTIVDYIQNHSTGCNISSTSYGDLIITIQEPEHFILTQLEKFLAQNNALNEIDF